MQSKFKFSLFKFSKDSLGSLVKLIYLRRNFSTNVNVGNKFNKQVNKQGRDRSNYSKNNHAGRFDKSKSIAIRDENRIVNNIIENYDEPVKLSEDDIHKALEKTGKLPEFELKEILQNHKLEEKITTNPSADAFDTEMRHEIQNKILSKLNLNLNKSIVEICKIAKKNPTVFSKFELFWVSIENELKTREDSITNEQITEIISAFSKCELTPRIKIYEAYEDLICDSPIPFSHFETERIFYSYSAQKKGSSPFLKICGRRFFRYKDIIESARLAKFLSELNSHPQTIKGNFGFLIELEEKIKNEIEKKEIKLVDLISIASYLFKDNLGSNDIQHLIELSLLEKFENKIDVDITQIIKLVKAISGYYIKSEELCHKIKNFIETYLNGFIQFEENVQADEKKNINIEFTEQYMKLVTNINVLIWSFARNETFLKLRKNSGYSYFFNRLKEIFLKNLEYFNSRELTYSIEGLLKLLNGSNSNHKAIFSYEEVTLINEKITNLKEDFKPHEAIKLLTILLSNSNLIRTGGNSIEGLFQTCSENLEKMSYQDIIQFTNISLNFSVLFEKTSFSFLEKRLSAGNLFTKMNINSFCTLIKLVSIPLMNNNLTKDFYDKLKTMLLIRINEVPKEEFCEIFSHSSGLKLSAVVEKKLDILEDLSQFERIEECFNKPEEIINLLWSLLSIYLRSDWNIKLKQKENNFIDKILRNFLIGNSFNETDSNKDRSYLIDNLKNLLNDKMGIIFKTKDSFLDREESFKKFIQTGFLAFLYLKEVIPDLNKTDLKNILETIVDSVSSLNSKFDMDARSNFISLDSASKCNKEVIDDVQNEVMDLFKRKVNTSICPNFIDEFMNPINIIVYFETPKLKINEKVLGIDAKKFAVFVLNKYYNIHGKETFILFDNRFKILKEVFKWEIILIPEEDYTKLKNKEDKQNFLKKLFEVDFDDEQNINIKIEQVESTEEDDSNLKNLNVKDKSPKYKLTKSLLKSNSKKN